MRLFLVVLFWCVLCLKPMQAADQSPDVNMGELLTHSLSLTSFEEQVQVVYSPDWFQASLELSPYVKRYNDIAENHKKSNLCVHTFNGLYNWKENLPKLIAIDNKIFHTSSHWKIEEVIDFLKNTVEYQGLDKGDQDILGSNLLRLVQHIKQNPVEAGETGCHVPQMFSRVWSLITLASHPQWVELANRSEEIYSFMFFINENSLESGGCYQGYAGRICRNYLILMQKMLGLSNIGDEEKISSL